MNNKSIFPFIFCLAIILGPAYNMYVHYDFSHSSDTQSYLKMSKGDYNVNPVHRYRFIIPFSANILSVPIKKIYTKLWPHRAETLWPLQLSYFLINSIIVALYGMILYKLISLYSTKLTSILISLIAVLTSRWVSYIAGLPLTDSLYLLFIVSLLYSIKINHKTLFIISILFGGLIKESFLLFSPLILLTGPFKWYLRGFIIVLGLLIVFGEHWLIDNLIPMNNDIGIKNENLLEILIRTSSRSLNTFLSLISFRGLGEIFTVLGVFTFALIYGVLKKDCRNIWKIQIERYYWYFFSCIIIHALISGDVARMLYFGSALYGILIVKVIDNLRSKNQVISSQD